MPFWSSELLQQRLRPEKLVDPFRADRVKHAAYELSLGEEVYITSSQSRNKVRLQPGDHVDIPPGQFALLHTAETVRIPADAIAFLSIKAKIKLKGLINVSGFHVDPGFRGELVFSVYNAGCRSVRIACGAPVFLIWFGSLSAPTRDTYSGGYANQKGISPQAVMEIDGDIASPATLVERIKVLENTVRSHGRVIAYCFVAFFVGLAVLIYQNVTNHPTNNEPASFAPHAKP